MNGSWARSGAFRKVWGCTKKGVKMKNKPPRLYLAEANHRHPVRQEGEVLRDGVGKPFVDSNQAELKDAVSDFHGHGTFKLVPYDRRPGF
jgi:hypothetical protein